MYLCEYVIAQQPLLAPWERQILNFWCFVTEDEEHSFTVNEVELVIWVSSFHFLLGSPAAPMLSSQFGCIFQCSLLLAQPESCRDCRLPHSELAPTPVAELACCGSPALISLTVCSSVLLSFGDPSTFHIHWWSSSLFPSSYASGSAKHSNPKKSLEVSREVKQMPSLWCSHSVLVITQRIETTCPKRLRHAKKPYHNIQDTTGSRTNVLGWEDGWTECDMFMQWILLIKNSNYWHTHDMKNLTMKSYIEYMLIERGEI